MVPDVDLTVKLQGLLNGLQESLFRAHNDSIDQRLRMQETQAEVDKMIGDLIRCQNTGRPSGTRLTKYEQEARARMQAGASEVAALALPKNWGALQRVDISYWCEADGVHYSVGGQFDDQWAPVWRGKVIYAA